MTDIDKKITEFENFKSKLVRYGYADYNSKGEFVSTVLWNWDCTRQYKKYQNEIDELLASEED